MSDVAVQASRPTVSVAGQDQPSLMEGLVRLRIEETLDGLSTCEATFGNWGPAEGDLGFLYFDRRTLEFGKEIQFKVGGDALFTGRIMALEAEFPEGRAPSITVLAEDRLQDLRMTRRTRAFQDMSDADVARQVASDHGLTPDVDASGPTHKVLSQLNQSDLAFLRERARAIDADLRVSGSTLTMKTFGRSSSGTPHRLGFGHELRRFVVAADLAHQRTSVTVSGWDVAAKTALSERADDAAVTGELAGAESGASVLRSALAERKETVAHAVPLTSAEARAKAEAIFRGRARRFLRGRGTAETTVALRPGAKVKLEGLGPLFTGDYYLRDVRHLFDGEGLRTEFTAEKPGLGRP